MIVLKLRAKARFVTSEWQWMRLYGAAGTSSTTKLDHFSIIPHQRPLRHPDEQAVLDHARNAAQSVRQARRISNLTKRAVKDVMALVGDIGIPIGVAAQRYFRAESLDLRLDQ